MPPLTTPTLPAAHQGSCPAPGDCLLPLPAGSVDTTSSSYSISRSPSPLIYTAQFESVHSGEMATWMRADGFQSAQRRFWTTDDGVTTADEVLLKYQKPAQARAAAALEYGFNATDDRECTDSAVADSFCLAQPVDSADVLQDETVWVVAWKGDYEVSIAVTRSNAADVADAYTWARQQLDLLPSS